MIGGFPDVAFIAMQTLRGCIKGSIVPTTMFLVDQVAFDMFPGTQEFFPIPHRVVRIEPVHQEQGIHAFHQSPPGFIPVDDAYRALFFLSGIKEDGLVEKVGFSLYYPAELEYLFDHNVMFDFLQIPYSIFDQRFATYFPELKRRGIEVHSRSVFLQGLYFLAAEELCGQFDSIQSKVLALNEITQNNGISIQHLCLGFALLNPEIDRVVVGVDSVAQLESNLEIEHNIDAVNQVYDQLKMFGIEDEKILLPFLWKPNKKLVGTKA